MVLQSKMDFKTQEVTYYRLLVSLNNLLLLKNDALPPSVGGKLPLVQPSRENRSKLEAREKKVNQEILLIKIDQEIRCKEYKLGGE